MSPFWLVSVGPLSLIRWAAHGTDHVKRIILLGVVGAVFLATGTAAATPVLTPAPALNQLAERVPDAAKAAYGHGFGTINMEDSTSNVPPTIGTPVDGFSSLATFKAATVEAGSWVMYDLEWTADQNQTAWQLTHPRGAIASFVNLAHSRKLKVVLAVGLGLVEKVPTATCRRNKGEALVDAFLRCGIVRTANAVHADLFMTLTQRYVCDPPTFRAATKKVADAFSGPVYVEMTVLPSRECINAKRIYWNYRHVADSGDVQGLALWTSGQRGERPYEAQLTMAAKVLERLAA
jgi:hypothetical protein